MTETKAAVAPEQQTAWVPPTADSEFVFTDMGSLPAWADPSWQSNDGSGVALAVPGFAFAPAGEEMDRYPAYHSNVARVGDTVKWVEAERRFYVVRPTVLTASAEDLAQANIGVAPKDQVNPYDNPPRAENKPGIGALQNPKPTDEDLEDDPNEPTAKRAKKK